MTNFLFYALFFSMFLNFALGSIKYCGINRAFLSVYRGLFEACSRTIDENGNPSSPYYNKEMLENQLVKYFDANIKRYVSDYELKVYYFNDDQYKTVCTSKYCFNVEVSLKCDINMFFKYEKAQNFSLVDTSL